MKKTITLEKVTVMNEIYLRELSDILIGIVESGASVGFLPPLKESEANAYWQNSIAEDVILLIAKVDNLVAGTVQLQLCKKQNGNHRAEMAKLMTHPKYQRMGIGKMLMQEAEQLAKQHNRSLIVLDTREGDVSNLLYQSLGYIECGKIPYFALSANGQLETTIYYYKKIEG